eukprot:365067-Chlamydomonas_euryale.AAC.32
MWHQALPSDRSTVFGHNAGKGGRHTPSLRYVWAQCRKRRQAHPFLAICAYPPSLPSLSLSHGSSAPSACLA